MSFTKYTKEHWKGSVITSPLPPTLVSCGHEGKKMFLQLPGQVFLTHSLLLLTSR